jgi:hypothetical protein
MRSPQITGLETPCPGSGAFQRMFFSADHSTGRFVSELTPLRPGPRHSGQFSAVAIGAESKQRAVQMMEGGSFMKHRGTEGTERTGKDLDDHAFDAIFEQGNVEVNEKSDSGFAQSQVREQWASWMAAASRRPEFDNQSVRTGVMMKNPSSMTSP